MRAHRMIRCDVCGVELHAPYGHPEMLTDVAAARQWTQAFPFNDDPRIVRDLCSLCTRKTEKERARTVITVAGI